MLFAISGIPVYLLIANSCPEHLEAVVFGQLASILNIAGGIAGTLGASLMEIFHVNPSGSFHEEHQFDNMAQLSLVTVGISLIPLLALPWMIPNIPVTQRFVQEGTVSLTEGSYYERWCSKYQVHSSDP